MYHLNKLLDNNPLHIVDIGASGGISKRWRKFGSNCNAILFEPDSREVDNLRKSSNNSYKIIPIGLSEKKGNIKLHLCKKQEVSSIYEPNFNLVKKFHDAERFDVIRKEDISVDTLDNQLFENSIHDIDFIKIDTQGHELSILKGSKDTLKNVIGLELEVEFLQIYRNQPLFTEVNDFVTQNGFELFDIKRYYWKLFNVESNFVNKKGQLIFGDALYFRTPDYLFNNMHITQSKVIRVICVYLVYGYYDLAKAVFDIAVQKGLLKSDYLERLKSQLKFCFRRKQLSQFRGGRKIREIMEKIGHFCDGGPYSGGDIELGN